MFKDATHYNKSADHIASLVEEIQAKHGHSQREVAKKIGIGFSTLRDLMHGRSNHNYPTQFILESLLESGAEQNQEKAMYQIRKISTTNTNPRYDGHVACKTFAEVREYLDENTALFYGRGADILDAGDSVLFHTKDFQAASVGEGEYGAERKVVPTLKACIAAANESL